MPLVPQPLPWTVTAGREVGDGDGNVVQYTIANLGLICLAVNTHDRLMGIINQVETWLRSDPSTRIPELELFTLVSSATGRLGYGALAAKIEDAQSGSPDLDRAISVELQIPEATYTSSIDAALSLVPNSYKFSYARKDQLNPITCLPDVYQFVELTSSDGKAVTATSLTLPIAICAAALKTKEI